jgi:hypothetical protein
VDFHLRPRLDLFLFGDFSVGRAKVRLVVVWVLPKLPVECVPLKFNLPLFPVLSYYLAYQILRKAHKFESNRVVDVLEEQVCHESGLVVSVHKCNFLQAVKNPFELFFRKQIWVLGKCLIETLEVNLVLYSEFVVLILKFEHRVISVNLRDIF